MRHEAYRTRPEGVSPVQDARLAKRLTQARVAKLAGVGVLTVKRIERGTNVSRVALVAVRAVVGLPPPAIGEGSGQTPKAVSADTSTMPLPF